MILMRLGPPGRRVPVVLVDDDTYVDVVGRRPRLRRGVLRRGRTAPLAAAVGERVAAGGPSRAGAGGSAHRSRARTRSCASGSTIATTPRRPGRRVPDEPILFTKSPNTLIGPNDDVLIPRGSTKTDWEVELGVVIGSRCRYLADEARPRRDRRLRRRQRRQRARVPDRARRSVVEGQVGGDVQPGRAVAGDPGRGRRRPRARHDARRQRHPAPERLDVDDGLQPDVHRSLPEPVPRPRARRPHQHGHAAWRRDGPQAAGLPRRPATSWSSPSSASARSDSRSARRDAGSPP